jgi:hypothetical protein
MQSPLAGNSYISNKADCRRAIYCVTPVTPELDRGLPAWRWIRRSKYGKSVAVLGAGLVGEQEREVIGTLEISYWGITRSWMLGSFFLAQAVLAQQPTPIDRLQVNRRLNHFRARFLQLNRRPTLIFAARLWTDCETEPRPRRSKTDRSLPLNFFRCRFQPLHFNS